MFEIWEVYCSQVHLKKEGDSNEIIVGKKNKMFKMYTLMEL